MRLLLSSLFILTASAQSLTYTPQGAAALKVLTGRRIKGIQIVSVIACPAAISLPSISGGEIYQDAISKGYQPILPEFARAVITDAAARSKWVYVLEAYKVASIVGAGLGAGGTVKMSASALAALVIGHQVGDELAARIEERLPNTGSLINVLLDPRGKLDITQGCQTSAFIAVYPGKSKGKVK